jgi:hypothetical protein
MDEEYRDRIELLEAEMEILKLYNENLVGNVSGLIEVIDDLRKNAVLLNREFMELKELLPEHRVRKDFKDLFNT